MRNVEIKALLRDAKSVEAKAKELSGSGPTIIKQSDTFFVVSNGRLKLRSFEDGSGELILYERPDTEGPKLCRYTKVELNDETACNRMTTILERTNGIVGVVKKIRHLYLVGQSRIHIDQVENLGSYMEIEVVLKDDQEPEEGEEILKNLRNQLGISENDQISIAYIDMLSQNK